MIIDEDGRVDIGSPCQATVSSSANRLVVASDYDSGNAGMTIHSTGTSSGQMKLSLTNANGADAGAALIYQNSNNKFLINSNGATERWSIDANGFQHQKNSSATPYGTMIEFTAAAPDNRTSYFFKLDDNVATRGNWWSDGDITTSDGGSVNSDERLKTNIVDATNKLVDVMALKVRNFEWTPEYHPAKVGEKKIGFIAQELETVFPSLVSETDIAPNNSVEEQLYTADDDIPDGKTIGDVKVAAKAHEPVMRKTIKDAFAPILVKALQEVVARLEAAETKIAALEAT